MKASRVVIAVSLFVVGGILVFAAMGSGEAGPPTNAEAVLASSVSPKVVEEKLSKFAVAPVGVKPGAISPKHLRLIGKLVEAADHLDRVFWYQVSDEGLAIPHALLAEGSERAAALAELMSIHYGPWDRLANNEPFVGTRSKPAGGAFFPPDLSRRELQLFMDTNPGSMGDLLSPYTVVRRKGPGLVAIPYSVKYREDLRKAAGALREAAAFSKWDSLKEFLLARADALGSDDYYPSEMKWMDTDNCPYVVVMGPYEFYEDLLTGTKAAFEAIIALKDDNETKRFKGLGEQVEGILATLPLKAELKERLVTTKLKPIIVADEIYAAGDTRSGAQTTAFTLPNDARVREQKGTRQVVLRNVARAKFNHSWLPLTRVVVAEDQNVEITFGSYFDQLIAVELARGIRPGVVKLPDGTEATARQGLRQRYHTFEEAKSDALGLYISFHLMEKGLIDKRSAISVGATYLASVFRVIRFDVGGAHGLAKAIVFNSLAKRGAFVYDPTTKRYRVETEKLKTAVVEVLAELFDVLVNADYDKAGRLIIEHGLLPGDVREMLTRLADVPVDIKPLYTIKSALKDMN